MSPSLLPVISSSEKASVYADRVHCSPAGFMEFTEAVSFETSTTSSGRTYIWKWYGVGLRSMSTQLCVPVRYR